jgi:hypothetical protein
MNARFDSVGAALTVAIIGLVGPAALVVLLVLRDWPANDIATVIGLFTGLVGTMVGAFLGVQVGSVGKQEAVEARKEAESVTRRALAALPVAEAERVLAKPPQ